MIRTLNLDCNFIPIDSLHIEYNCFKFNGGELNIKIHNPISLNKDDKVIITNRILNSDDVFKIIFAKDALERLGVKNIDLLIPYFPYARQDRVCNIGESFTLKMFSNIINSLKFNNVYILDPHSDAIRLLVDNYVPIYYKKYVKEAYYHISDIDTSEVVLISPDSGANKKANALFESIGEFDSLVKCDKKRDLATGFLSDFEVFTDDLKHKSCLIVDDICDGGGTFVGLAKELKKKNAGNLYLYVSHGIFSKGFTELEELFKRVYTTNSFKDIDYPELVTQFKLEV